MKLSERINQDFIGALKAKNELIVSTLRMLKSAVHNKEIEIGKVVDNGLLEEMVSKQIKQRKDSMAEYKKGGRADLYRQEENEIKVLQKYLPKQLSESEIAHIVESAIKKTGAVSLKEMGKVMAEVMPLVKGKSDSSLVAKTVKTKLAK